MFSQGISPNGRFLAVTARSESTAKAPTLESLEIWDLASGLLRAEIPTKESVNYPCFSPDATRIVMEDPPRAQHPFSVWSTETGTRLMQFPGHDMAICHLAWSVDGTMVASAGHDGMVKLWDSSTGKLLQNIRGECQVCLFVENDECLVGVDDRERLWRTWNTRSGKLLSEQPMGDAWLSVGQCKSGAIYFMRNRMDGSWYEFSRRYQDWIPKWLSPWVARRTQRNEFFRFDYRQTETKPLLRMLSDSTLLQVLDGAKEALVYREDSPPQLEWWSLRSCPPWGPILLTSGLVSFTYGGALSLRGWRRSKKKP